MTQRCSAPEFQKELLVHVAFDQAASEPNPPPDDSQPTVSMPGAWQTHCSGCRAPAPETEPRGAADKHCHSTAGCRCLLCPDWFACLACAEKQVAAHQAAHPDEVHVVYCVATADEQSMLDSEATPPVISRWSFAFEAFVWPFLKMFLPCISVLLQVVSFCARLS